MSDNKGLTYKDAGVDTKEEAPPSGRYLIRVWINDVLASETLNEL